METPVLGMFDNCIEPTPYVSNIFTFSYISRIVIELLYTYRVDWLLADRIADRFEGRIDVEFLSENLSRHDHKNILQILLPFAK